MSVVAQRATVTLTAATAEAASSQGECHPGRCRNGRPSRVWSVPPQLVACREVGLDRRVPLAEPALLTLRLEFGGGQGADELDRDLKHRLQRGFVGRPLGEVVDDGVAEVSAGGFAIASSLPAK